MKRHLGISSVSLLLALCVLAVGCGQPAAPQLSAPAAQAIQDAYPGATVKQVKLETEDGQRLYEVKLLKGGSKLEVTLAENGTIMEVESAVEVKDLPKAVIEAIAKAAPEAKIEKAKKQEVFTDAKLTKLTSPKVRYEVEVKQGHKEGELAVAADGTVLEPLKWQQEQKEEKGQKEDADDEDHDAPKGGSAASRPEQGFRNEFLVDKANLADSGTNPYFILKPGYRLTLQDGKDTLTITVLDETKLIDGVKTRVVEERETKGNQLAEVSRNYFAIDPKTQDIYYFGEDVDEYKDGKVAAHGGSWRSGVDGAKFGLRLPGNPKVGDKFCQERAPKAAMDRSEIISLTEQMKTPAGEFKNVLCVKDSSGLEAGSESKWYAPGVGLLKDGGFELVKVESAK